jgi:UDP-2,3-diacylglucosamine pyrophosphatase LpxH
MSLQDQFLQTLFSVSKGGVDVRLVASLQHDCIGFPDRLHVFVPDIHLLTRERRAAFSYGTNYEGLLTDLVLKLKQFKSAAGASKVNVYQLGDLLDLWRQAPQLNPEQDVGAWIANDHQELIGALFDGDLGMRFILGNHDFNLCRFPNFDAWTACAYLQDSAGNTPAIALHGHQFDWEQVALEILPEPLKDALVFLFAPIWPEGKRKLGELIPLNEKVEAQMAPHFSKYIQPPQPAPLGSTRPASESIPSRFNVQTGTGQIPNGMRYAVAAKELCQSLDQQWNKKLNLAVIGHTHQARIALLDDSKENFFAIVDCGAWIEQYSTPEIEEPLLNAQIGVVGCNEARIYQLQTR